MNFAFVRRWWNALRRGRKPAAEAAGAPGGRIEP
jgi:hypothetical protein